MKIDQIYIVMLILLATIIFYHLTIIYLSSKFVNDPYFT